MMELSRWKVTLVTLATLLGLWLTLPNLLPTSVREQFKAVLPANTLNLGLDLQGGSYLLLEVDTKGLIKQRVSNLLEDVRQELRKADIPFTGLTQVENSVHVTIQDPVRGPDAQKLFERLSLPIDTAPGAKTITVSDPVGGKFILSYTDQAIAVESAKAVDQSIIVVGRRIDNLGTKEPSIQRQGANRIVVQAPGESDPEELKRVIGKTARLTFQMVDENTALQDALAGRIPADSQLLPYPEGEQFGLPPYLLVKKRVLVSGENLTKASVGIDEFQKPAIDFSFNASGARKFGSATANNIGKRFAIILDGEVVSAPTIKGAITTGSGQINGNFTIREASELVNILNGGALPAELIVEEQRTVTAELGADAVAAGQVSTIVAFACVLIFMVLAYGFLFGGISIAALLVNGLLLIGAMSVTQATLTLPGIAGLILTLAMAVDANVLIYERMRDEARLGRNPVLSCEAGFSKAMETIIDANLTTIGAAVILFMFGAGPVRGFAWTLSIGVITSVFSAVLVTQILTAVWLKTARPKTLPIA
ncbi:MAG: protein translocase subunit SecD [Asticcacaulis sp.]